MLSTRESYVTTARHQVTPYLSRCNSALLGCQDLVPHSHADESHLALCGCNPGVNSGCDALVVFLFHLHRCAFDQMKGEHAGSISAQRASPVCSYLAAAGGGRAKVPHAPCDRFQAARSLQIRFQPITECGDLRVVGALNTTPRVVYSPAASRARSTLDSLVDTASRHSGVTLPCDS